MMNEGRSKRELWLFRLTMWLVVLCCFAALVTKAIFGKPGSVPAHYLLVLAAAAALLAIIVPNVESYILSRISEVTFGGVKFVIAQTETVREWLDYEEITPEELSQSPVGTVQTDRPFAVAKLTGFRLYRYERLSFRLYQFFDRVKDPNDLDHEAKEHLRKLIYQVGKAAFAMQHFTKYQDIVSYLYRFKDRDLNADELFLLGHAHLWAADEQLDEVKRKDYLKKSYDSLHLAMKGNPRDVKIPFDLGVASLSLGYYNRGIDLMEDCMKLHAPIAPWAKWNIACALKKQHKDGASLKKLDEIPAGPWWDAIAKDDWFADPNNKEYERLFKNLCEAKKKEGKP